MAWEQRPAHPPSKDEESQRKGASRVPKWRPDAPLFRAPAGCLLGLSEEFDHAHARPRKRLGGS